MFRGNLNLMVAMMQVQASEDIAARQAIQQFIDAWQWVAIQTGVCIQGPKVHTKAQRTAFLACEQHRMAIWRS